LREFVLASIAVVELFVPPRTNAKFKLIATVRQECVL
jgi:hypothetical protein